MNLYILLGISFALLCLFFRYKPSYEIRLFSMCMLITCILAAIRYEFGPDYNAYMNTYYGLKGDTVDYYTGTGSTQERGFLLYLQLFPSFTFFIVVNTCLWFLANYLFFKKYVDASYYWIVILFFFLNSNYLMLNLVAMRSAMVSFLFLYAFFFLLKGALLDKAFFVLLILIASQFHTTGIVLVLFVFLSSKRNSLLFNLKFIGVVATIGIVAFLLGQNYVLQFLSSLAMDNIGVLDRYSESDDVTIGMITLSFNSLMFLLMSVFIAFYLAWAAKKETQTEYIFIYKIAIVAAIVQIMFKQSMIGDRYFMCFNPFYITALIHSLKNDRKKYGVFALMIVGIISIYVLANKMNRDYFIFFKEYHTVFEAPMIP